MSNMVASVPFRSKSLGVLGSLILTLTAGCATEPTLPVWVTVSPASAAVLIGQSLDLRATVGNDLAPRGATRGVTWTLTGSGCSGVTCGTLSSNRSPSNVAIAYTAPALVPIGDTVTITATSVTDGTKSTSITVAITSLVEVSLAATGLVGVDVGTAQAFTALVDHDPGNRGVRWAVSGGGCTGVACGTISPAGVYTAPPVVPSPAVVTVTAASVTDYTKAASATVVITTPGVVTVVVFPAVARIPVGGSTGLTAYVFHDLGSAGVTWSTSIGSMSSASSASGVAVVYRAPSSPGSAIVRATSVADTTRSATATVSFVIRRPPGCRIC